MLQWTIDSEPILKETVTTETSWTFNTPLAPHIGVSWERLVRSLKGNLMSIGQNHNASEEVLGNMLTELESTLNSRPLIHVPIDEDAFASLTPNHFLLGSTNGMKPLVPIDASWVILKRN